MSDLIQVDNMSPEELDILQHRILQRRMKDYEARLKRIEETQIIDRERSNQLLELERKRHRVAENRFGFVSLSDLGQQFTVSIGSKTMGNLLRIVGIAKAKQSITEPYREYITSGYAKSEMHRERPIYQYNPEKCIEKIDRWLKKHGLVDEFYSIDNEKELMAYINNLHEKHC